MKYGYARVPAFLLAALDSVGSAPPAPSVPEPFFAVLEFFIVILFKTVLIKLAEAALQNEVLPLLLSVEFFSR